MFDRLNLFYQWGYATKEQLRKYVELKALSEEEYEEITEESYTVQS